jgi:hypothetical protein
MITILTIVSSLLFALDNKIFFEKVQEQTDNGATWKYIGATPIDRNAEQLFEFPSLDGEKMIMFKLKEK